MPNVTPLRADDPDRIGHYRLAGRLSGMPGGGPFYLAAGADGSELAVRLLHGPWTHDAAARDRFAAEAGSARRVPPFCAARVIDSGAQDGQAWLVSEFISGPSLLEAVAGSGRLRGPGLDALAIGTATGLAAVHQAGLVHGGFGPEHVILSDSGPRIIEYGITPPYGQATPAADMLAWAQTIVFASMGRPPATMADLDVLPQELRDIVADCLDGDPGLRPEARAVVLDLLGESAPMAGMLAEGSRRAAQITEAVRRGTAGRKPAQQARPAGRAPAGRPEGGTGPAQAGRRPAPRQGPGRRAARPARRRVPVVPVGIAVVVIAAVVFVLARLAGGSSPPSPATAGSGGSGSPSAGSTSPVSSTRSAPAPPAATVSAAFAGSWTGTLSEPGPAGVVLDVRITLAQGATQGTIAYSGLGGFSCSGEVAVQSASAGRMRLSQGIITGQKQCGNGEVTLADSAAGTSLRYTFSGAGVPSVTGTLTKG